MVLGSEDHVLLSRGSREIDEVIWIIVTGLKRAGKAKYSVSVMPQ
jgi:hypothetical protein